jgi:hypothetical protein
MLGRRIMAIGAAGLLATLIAASSAGATTGAGWSGSTAIPDSTAGSSHAKLLSYPGGGMLLYFDDAGGAPAVASFSGGKLGAAEEVPSASGLGNRGIPAQAAVLANGDAVFSWELSNDSNATWMAYRYADGSWGPAIGPVDGFDALAARSGEVLGIVGAPNASTVTVDQFSVGAGGTLTAGPTSTIFSGALQGWGEAGIALDPGGAADAVFDSQTEGVVQVQRASTGAWGSPVVEPSTGPGASVYGASNFTAASSPGGALIASWQLLRHDYTNTAIYAATRQPGGSLGTAVPIANASGGQSGTGVSQAIAGGDGTLAVDFSTAQCASTSADVVNGYGLAIAAPGGSLGAVTNESEPITSLAAGDGEAAIVLQNVNTTGFASGSDPANWPCSGGGFSGNPVLTTTWVFGAAIVSGSGQQVSSQQLASGVTHSPAPQAGDFEPVADASGLDTAGNAAFLGSFESSGALDLITYGSPGFTGTSVGSPSGGGSAGPGGGPTGPGGGPTGSGGSSGSGSGAGGTPTIGPAGTSGSGTASVARAIGDGAAATVSLSCEGSGGSLCSVDLKLTVVETVAGGRVVAVTARKAKLRTVTVGSLRTTLTAAGGRKLKLPLNATGMKLLKRYHRLRAHLAVTESGKSVAATTVTFTLPAKHR